MSDSQDSSKKSNKAVPFEPLLQVGGKAAGSAKKAGNAIGRFFHRLFVSIALLAIGFASCFLMTKFGYLPSFEPPVLSEEHTTITVKELGKVIEPAADLVTSRYRYTDADTADTSKQLLGFDVPLTRDMVVFTYDGVVSVGFDINEVEFEVEDGTEGEKGEITVTLPELKVVQNEIDMDSFDYAYEEHSIFNQQDMEHTTEILGQLKKKAEKRALGDEDFITEAYTNSETTIRSFLEAAHVGDYYKTTIVLPTDTETETQED